ncbi:MAG: DUF192 domain-containing protein [Pseudomonadota bacterium]|jgi:hypothetical protein
MTFRFRSLSGLFGRRRALAWLAALAWLWSAALGASGTAAADREPLEIITQSGVQVFSVEVMRTDEERAHGLMFRKSLPDGQGMLFDFNPEQNVSMWMKNTLIPLDMIFIQSDGRILRIAENTQVQSERIIPSGGPVRGVLEVIAGTSKKLGIRPGDRVAHPLFAGK